MTLKELMKILQKLGERDGVHFYFILKSSQPYPRNTCTKISNSSFESYSAFTFCFSVTFKVVQTCLPKLCSIENWFHGIFVLVFLYLYTYPTLIHGVLMANIIFENTFLKKFDDQRSKVIISKPKLTSIFLKKLFRVSNCQQALSIP